MAGTNREGLNGPQKKNGPIPNVTPQTRVGDLLAQHPKATMVFIRRGMACPGCELNIFDTLAGAARSYGVPVEELINSIVTME